MPEQAAKIILQKEMTEGYKIYDRIELYLEGKMSFSEKSRNIQEKIKQITNEATEEKCSQ